MKIKDILKDKGLEVIAVDSDVNLDNAVTKMIKRGIGAVLVSENGQIQGMFTERDALKNWGKGNVQIKTVMSRNLKTIDINETIEKAMSVMTNEGIRHLPVKDGIHIVGLISIRDVVKYHVENLKSEVQYLKDFIIQENE